jgi:hypothetical protein
MINLTKKDKKLLEIVFKYAINNGNGYKSIRSRYLSHSGTPRDEDELRRDLFVLEKKLEEVWNEHTD